MQSHQEDELREPALRWLGLLPRAMTSAREGVGDAFRGPRGREVLCHGDLGPAHVRPDGDSLAGFTDFESPTFASPAFALAQLVTHFGGWETEEAMLRSYEFGAPLQGSDRDTLPAEAIADLICKGLWPLGALYGGSSTRGPPPRRNGQRTS